MEKTVKVSHLIKPIYYCLFATLFEIINFLWLRFETSGGGIQILPTYFVLDLAVFVIVAGIISVLPRKGANAVMYVFIGLQALINIVNATLYKVFGDIFSFDMMKLGAEAVSAFKLEFIDFWSILANFALLAGLIVLQVLLDRKMQKEVTLKKLGKRAFKEVCVSLALIVGFSGFYGQTLSFADSEKSARVYASDKYLWDNQHFKLESYKSFGTWGFYYKSLANLIYKNDKLTKKDKADIKALITSGKQAEDTSATLYGDNLIIIMLESFEWFAIDPYNTPTLWDIKTNSGVSFEKFYGKNKTNVSEDIAILGNMPKDTSMDYLAANDLLGSDYTLPNMFKQRGYTVNYFHGYKKSFYDRDKVNKAMGFDHVYGIEDANISNKSLAFNNWNLDSDVVDAFMDEFIPEDKNFVSFLTTITTHGTYARSNERFSDYYKTYDRNLSEYKTWLKENTDFIYPTDKNYQSYLRQYKCAAMDTDKMVYNVIENLKAKGVHDNTTIVLYSDHNCYYQDLCYEIKGTEKDDYTDIYNYNIPCMIYNPKLTPEQNYNFVNTYDIFPTICELYGLPYNTTLTQGYNMFSEDIENSTMVSYLTGIFDDKFYSLNISDTYEMAESTKADLKAFTNNATKFYDKQYNIELIYKYGLAL